MKIISIFANQLFTFHYENETENELRRLLNLWNDSIYLYSFVIQNKADAPKNTSVQTIINQLIKNANYIDDILNEISKDSTKSLEEFFKPLNNQECQIVDLSKQKGRKNYLRIYAIRVDKNCFIITGGAIKFHHLNKQRIHTQREMEKINKCQDYLKTNGVFDSDSFYEFLIEQL